MAIKTYSHLTSDAKIPNQYEIVTTDLLYYLDQGVELRLPLNNWYESFQNRSIVSAQDLKQFHDPYQITYTKFVEIQKQNEDFTGAILKSIDETSYDKSLPASWLDTLELILSPARFLFHGLQMTAAYIGSMARASRLAIVFMFQAVNDMKWLQRMTYRVRQLKKLNPQFGEAAKEVWLEHEKWQPARKNVEKLLVTYDWVEAFIALNVVLRPQLDHFLLSDFRERAVQAGDSKLAEILYGFESDSHWRSQWTWQLEELIKEAKAPNEEIIEKMKTKWQMLTEPAVVCLSEL